MHCSDRYKERSFHMAMSRKDVTVSQRLAQLKIKKKYPTILNAQELFNTMAMNKINRSQKKSFI